MFKIQSLFFPNSLQAWGSNLFTQACAHCTDEFWRSDFRQYELHRQKVIFHFSLHFLTGTELHRNGEVHGGSMKNSKFKIFKIQISKYSKFKVYSPTAFRLGVPISLPRLVPTVRSADSELVPRRCSTSRRIEAIMAGPRGPGPRDHSLQCFT